MRARIFLASFVFPIAALALSAGNARVETVGACTDPLVSDAMRAELSPAGVKVTTATGPLCEVWLRQSIPQQSGATGADYGSLTPGTFVGVIRYAAQGGDYKGQAVRVGTYTLRYQTIPQDGNHLGVSPTPDFLLLAPAADDKDPAATVGYAELVKLGKAAAGTNHPNPLHLDAPAGGAPSFRMGDAGHGILELKTKLKGGGGEVDFPIALILVGKSEG